MNLSITATKAIEAYGGIELWRKAQKIQAVVSAKGLAFTLKRRTPFEHSFMEMALDKPYATITPIGKAQNIKGVLDGNAVRIEKNDGTLIAQRDNPRKYFPYGRRLFYWDDLDMAYFANYAFWNYFTLPRLLINPDIQWNEIESGFLKATFPSSIPTHCQIQEFHFDRDTGLLKQHNYAADVISSLANAANVVTQHKTIDGVAFTSKRIVTPKSKSGKPMKKPVLIDIDVTDFKIITEK